MTDFFRRLTPVQLTIDIVLALIITLIGLPVAFLAMGVEQTTPTPWQTAGGIVVLILAAGAVALRRLSPPLALTVAWAAAILLMLFQRMPGIEAGAIMLVLFATSAYGSTRVMWWGLGSAGAGTVLAALYIAWMLARIDEGIPDPEYGLIAARAVIALVALIATGATLGLSWAAGLILRLRIRSRDADTQRAVSDALAAAEAERVRIARDMHDVVAHSLAVVIAQADGRGTSSPQTPMLRHNRFVPSPERPEVPWGMFGCSSANCGTPRGRGRNRALPISPISGLRCAPLVST